MLSTRSLLPALKRDFPDIHFSKGNTFRWSPDERTVYYANTTDIVSLLHEVAHALLNHARYERDIELIKMERAAWDYTTDQLAEKYGVEISDEYIESMLDTYRDWLHSRSLCPTCEATGIQTDTSHYTCLACEGTWRVNEARICALRRYKVDKTKK